MRNLSHARTIHWEIGSHITPIKLNDSTHSPIDLIEVVRTTNVVLVLFHTCGIQPAVDICNSYNELRNNSI